MPHTLTSPLTPAHRSDCDHCATRSLCITARMPEPMRAALRPQITEHTLQRGEELQAEGAVADEVLVLKLGRVIGYRKGLDGRSRVIGMRGRGASFGLFGLLGQVAPVTVSVAAASTSRVCRIPVAALRPWIAADPETCRELTRAAIKNCTRVVAWSEAMRLGGVTNQLAYSLLLLAQDESQPVVDLPRQIALGELLGTSRETVARSLALLEAEGGIRRLEKKKCEIDSAALMTRLRGPSAA